MTPSPTPVDSEEVVVSAAGIAEAELDREVADVSVAELEVTFGQTAFLAGQSDTCGLGIWVELGFAVVTDADQAVTAMVFERDDVVTTAGVRIGDDLQAVVAAHGEAALTRVDSAPTPAGGALLVVADERPEDGGASLHLAYELDGEGRVARIRAGHLPQVGLPAYCGDVAPRPQATGWPLLTEGGPR